MAHRDQGQRGTERTCADDLDRALRWITAKTDWSGIRVRKDCTWTPLKLAWAALLWAWSDEKTLSRSIRHGPQDYPPRVCQTRRTGDELESVRKRPKTVPSPTGRG